MSRTPNGHQDWCHMAQYCQCGQKDNKENLIITSEEKEQQGCEQEGCKELYNLKPYMVGIEFLCNSHKPEKDAFDQGREEERSKILKIIREEQEKGFEPVTILETVELYTQFPQDHD